MTTKPQCITATWHAPNTVHAFTTTRQGGVSVAPYQQFNLATHVGDDPIAVANNRQRFQSMLPHVDPVCWIELTHGTEVVTLDSQPPAQPPQVDAVITRTPGVACTVTTADCLPILLCNRAGTEVAAIHAGWRGLLHGVTQSTLTAMHSPATELMAWLGPAIGPNHFEINEEIQQQFLQRPPFLADAFHQQGHHIFANLYQLAQHVLKDAGISAIFGGTHCTFSESDLFFSYRRDKKHTGRMASVIWIS